MINTLTVYFIYLFNHVTILLLLIDFFNTEYFEAPFKIFFYTRTNLDTFPLFYTLVV